MDEYAIRVYSLLNQSFRLDAIEALEDIQITVLPHAKKEAYDSVVRYYQQKAKDINESMTVVDGEPGAIEKLKKIFGGN